MAERVETGQGQGGGDEYTQDGTVDLRGNPIACFFVVVYEVFKKITYGVISSHLILYLTIKLHQDIVFSANNVTNWVGTNWMTSIIGAYITDTHLGRHWTFMIVSIIYLFGMSLITLAVSLPSLRPPRCGAGTDDPNCQQKASSLQLGIFFLSLYILAVGTGGTKPNISTIGADQFDDFGHKLFSIFFGTLFTNAPFYRHQPTSESPFAKMARVIIAAMRKCAVVLPEDHRELHELDPEHYTKKKASPLPYTANLRILSKAAVKTGNTSRWALSTVTQVEETKQMLKMLPVLAITFVPSAMMAQINTLFVKQGTTLARHIGPHFQIPPASLQGFVTISRLVAVVLYDRLFMPFMRRCTKNPRGISMLQRMGVGLVIHIVIMAIASVTERHRLNVAHEHGIFESKGTTIPLTIFVLLPQFVLMGVADAFLEVAKIEFFYDQAPEGMKSLGTSYAMTSLGIGNFLSSFLLTTVSRVTARHGRPGWILNNLNASRLDHYYAFFAVLNCVNLVFFFVVCRLYVYKDDTARVVDGSGAELQPREVATALNMSSPNK